jgi:hypothetical protein
VRFLLMPVNCIGHLIPHAMAIEIASCFQWATGFSREIAGRASITGSKETRIHFNGFAFRNHPHVAALTLSLRTPMWNHRPHTVNASVKDFSPWPEKSTADFKMSEPHSYRTSSRATENSHRGAENNPWSGLGGQEEINCDDFTVCGKNSVLPPRALRIRLNLRLVFVFQFFSDFLDLPQDLLPPWMIDRFHQLLPKSA